MNRIILNLLLLGLMGAPCWAQGVRIVNDPGAPTTVESHVVTGKWTIVEFFSDHCPPCRRVAPMLAELTQSKPDTVVRRINIDRKNSRGIDWTSPVARQYGIHRVPYFKVYDKKGRLTWEGDEATNRVVRWLSEYGILR